MEKIIINPLFNTKQIIALGANPGADVLPNSGTVFYWLTLENQQLYANYRIPGEVEDRKYQITDPDKYYNVDLKDKVNSPITYDETNYTVGYSDGYNSYDLLLKGIVVNMSLNGDILTINKSDNSENFTIDFKLSDKVDKIEGYALSKNDFTDVLLTKLNGIENNANNYSLPTASTSVKGGVKVGDYLYVQNETIKAYSITCGNGLNLTKSDQAHNFDIQLNLQYSENKTYAKNDVVLFNKRFYCSLINSNKGNSPDTDSVNWNEIGNVYAKGNGININNNVISVDTETIATTEFATYTKGDGIIIDNNVVSVDSEVVALKTDKLQGKINVVDENKTTLNEIETIKINDSEVVKNENVATITVRNTIETVKINDELITITNRQLAFNIPTKVSQLTNDSEYTTKGFETPINVVNSTENGANITTPENSTKVVPFLQKNLSTNKFELALKKHDGSVQTISGSGGGGGTGNGFTFRDNYTGDTVYEINDAVRYNGAIWRCKGNTINVAPPTVEEYENGTASAIQLESWGLILKDGYSSYQVWLNLGYSGTEEEYLSWLRNDTAFQRFTNNDLVNKKVTITAYNAVVGVVDNLGIQWQLPQGSVVYSAGQATIDLSGIMAMKDVSSIDGEWKVALAGGVSSIYGTGADGTNAFLYIAYASDDKGSNFSLTPNDELKYVAQLQTTIAISNPVLSDFVNCKWVKYLGDTNYHYIAYASDDKGSDFSLTPSKNLSYRAEF